MAVKREPAQTRKTTSKKTSRNRRVSRRLAKTSFGAVTVDAIRQGLPTSSVEMLRKRLEVTQSQLESLLHIPHQTYSRRKGAGKLTAAESDRVVRFGRLVERAAELLGEHASAVNWLKTPAPAFQGETPLERATTELGAQQVSDLIAQLEHGIPA